MTDHTVPGTIRRDNVFVSLGGSPRDRPEHDRIAEHFCGTTCFTAEEFAAANIAGKNVYIGGDLGAALEHPRIAEANVFIVDNLCTAAPTPDALGQVVQSDQVPLGIAGAGVFVRRFFRDETLFGQITAAHKFQNLTESTKPDAANRTGVYLSRVERTPRGTRFNLLRCSTNLDGPTLGFRRVDDDILHQVNGLVREWFAGAAPVNHVLAQIYHNKVNAAGKQKKAAISAHSDKTKDMPANGVIAFCSFYDGLDKVPAKFRHALDDPCDWQSAKGSSVFTQLEFRHKVDPARSFSITLYPNSLFVIPLSTNRQFTHRTVPSGLSVDVIPVRMGYVARCSAVEALHHKGVTYLRGCHQDEEKEVPLREPDEHSAAATKKSYRDENLLSTRVEYGNIPISFNRGDRMQPLA